MKEMIGKKVKLVYDDLQKTMVREPCTIIAVSKEWIKVKTVVAEEEYVNRDRFIRIEVLK